MSGGQSADTASTPHQQSLVSAWHGAATAVGGRREEGMGRDRMVASLAMFLVCIYTTPNSQLGSTFSVFRVGSHSESAPLNL